MKPIEIVATGRTYLMDLPEADHDYIQKTIATTHRPYEEAMLIDIANIVEPGQLVLDVGANCGNHTLYLSCVAGAEVHAFEPDGELCSSIRSSVSLNEVDHLVTIHEVGVGEAVGFGRLVQTAEHNRGAQRLERVRDNETQTRIVRLDDLCFSKPVRVIKIDVEGMELDVLRGARDLIEKDHPQIYVECQTRQEFERTNRWLMEFGYRYQSTFNATPTHHFSTHGSADSGDRFEQVISQQVAAVYYDQQLIARLRENLAEANAKYRGATAQSALLSEQLRLTSTSDSRQSERVEELEVALRSAQGRDEELEVALRSAQGRIEELEVALRSAQGRIEELGDVADAREVENDELKTRLVSGNNEKARLIADAEIRDAALRVVRSALELERTRSEELQALIADANAVSLQLEAHFSELSQEWRQDREELGKQLTAATIEQSRLRQKAKQYFAKYRSALARKDEAAVRLSAIETELAEAESSKEETARRLTIEKGLASRLGTSLRDTESKLKSTASLAQQAQSEVQNLQAELVAARAQATAAERKTDSIRQSVTYRLGLVVRDSLKSTRNAIMLPAAISALALEHRRRGTVEGVVLSSTDVEVRRHEIEPTVVVDKPLINRASEIRASRLLSNSHVTSSLQLVADGERKTMRVAAIMDDFTVQSFAPECDLKELSLVNYIEELESFSPSFVFLESAWRGKGNEWGNRVAQTAFEVREIVAWANARSVPVILWNKEDPVHYSTFLNTAKLVDHVFTTDIDCVQKYKDDLGHSRVHFMPFACQPLLHNPLELYERSPGFCFAGAYYRRYPARTRDLESFMVELPKFAPLEIFDRNFGKTDEQYMFPEEYTDHIVGTLSSSEIDLAYKGYDYAINLNSVKESQSMFARRVFELFASNTTVVSNYSRGLQLMFGDLAVVADSGKEIVRQISSSSDKYAGRKRRLAALRKVMTEHTYSHRLEFILDSVGIDQPTTASPVIEVFCLVASDSELRSVLEAVGRQDHVDVILRAYSEDTTWFRKTDYTQDIVVTPAENLALRNPSELVKAGHLAAVMVPDDYYGKHYLIDLALAGRYSSASAVGKASFFEDRKRGVSLRVSGKPYTAVGSLPIRSSLMLKPGSMKIDMLSVLRRAETGNYEQDSLLGAEIFDYCRGGASIGNTELGAIGSGKHDSGTSLHDMTRVAAAIEAVDAVSPEDRVTSGEELAELFVTRARPGVITQVEAGGWSFESTLDDGVHDYLYSTRLLDLNRLRTGNHLEFHVEADPGLNLQIAIIFYSKKNEKISGMVRGSNQNQTLPIPEDASQVKVGIRIYSSGKSTLRRVLWKHKNLKPAFIAARAENLVLTNRYPSYGDLYKNGFVHSRVVRYVQSGVQTEVFVLNESSQLRFREFEGITVVEGSSAALETFLRDNQHRSISLHFVNEDMWAMVSKLPQRPRIGVWAHGADIQKWSRRAFLYQTQEEVARAQEASENRAFLWRRIFSELTDKMSVVFVSKWLADTALEDLDLSNCHEKSAVIHNPIDTDKFTYYKKSSKQRLKVLSIRPYASSVYANDLVVQAILLLSDRPGFSDLEFRLVGDGPLFEEITAPLRNFPNVILDQRFLTQDQIAEMHKCYGIFLCPSRMDTQGVSRDEAMASGLVPVTSKVAAIPQFVDETCAELVDPESAYELANAVTRLTSSKALFRSKSKAAAARVRRQSAASVVVPQELNLLGYRD